MLGDTSFGRFLKARRKVLDLTQAAVAERVGCAPQTVRHIEAGRLRPSRQIAARLADCLGIPADQRDDFVQAARTAAPANGHADLEDADAPSLACAALAPRTTAEPWPLIGRRTEQQHLRTAAASVVQRGPHLVVLSGDAGIGKTRLADEALQYATQHGLVTARAHCCAASDRLPYAPLAAWLQSPGLRSGLADLAAVYQTEVARLVPDLLVAQRDLPAPQPITECWQQQRVFEALARAIVGDGRPRVLLLDDLQRCDSETLAVLDYLLHHVSTPPVLVLAALRSGEVGPDHPVTALILTMEQRGRLTELALGPLDAEETATLAAHVLGQPLLPDCAAQLYRKTEGNPLFVVESVRAGAGGCAPSLHPAAAAPPGAAPTPGYTKGQAVIRARLAQLAPETRDLASVAATIGRAFSFGVLRAASGLDEPALVRELDELVARRIVREQGPDAYDFSHDKLREVAYSELSAARRRLLHRRVAEALEALYRNPQLTTAAQRGGAHPKVVAAATVPYPLLAYHWRAAGDRGKTMRYLALAGVAARYSFANDEAIRLLHEALALDDQLGTRSERRERATWEWHLGEAYYQQGNMAACGHHLARAVGLWGYRMPGSRGGLALGVLGQLLRQAVHRLLPTRLLRAPTAAQAHVLAATGAYERLARITYFANDIRACVFATVRSVNLGERAGPSPELAQAYAMLCGAAGFAGLRRLAGVYRRLACDLAERTDSPADIHIVSIYDVGVGHWIDAQHALERAIAICEHIGDRRSWEECAGMLARAKHYQGEYAASEHLAGAVATSAAQRGDDHSEGYALITRSMNLVCRGRYQEAIPLLRTAVEHLAGDRYQQMAALGLLAQAQLRLGQVAAAHDAAERAALVIAQSRPVAVLSLPGYAGVADFYLTRWEAGPGQADRPEPESASAAQQACDALASYARVFPIGRPQAWLYRGRLAWLAGKPAAAQAAWQQGVREAERLAMPFDVGLVHYEWGRHARGADRAYHLARARDVFSALGAHGYLDRMEEEALTSDATA